MHELLALVVIGLDAVGLVVLVEGFGRMHEFGGTGLKQAQGMND